jgi:(p)ppGpp synthase/HD superfamily hydrolase
MDSAHKFSKSKIDQLGDRLRKGAIDEDDLRLLDAYRRSFAESYEFVVDKIRQDLRLVPTGRPAKSTSSIIDKLDRESIRLSQIQDIAGCRIVVSD